MANVEVQIPAGIGSPVKFAGLVTALRVVRSRCVLSGAGEGEPQVSLQVLAEHGDELWLREGEDTGFGRPSRVSCFPPFVGGDSVWVLPSGGRGKVIVWAVTDRGLGVDVVYRVHLASTPAGDASEAEAGNLQWREHAMAE